jgi:hypothetical protein
VVDLNLLLFVILAKTYMQPVCQGKIYAVGFGPGLVSILKTNVSGIFVVLIQVVRRANCADEFLVCGMRATI